MKVKTLAVYEKNVLRPLEPISLREGQRVSIEIATADPKLHKMNEGHTTYTTKTTDEPHSNQDDQRQPSDEESALEALIERLIREGRMRPRPSGPVPPPPLSETEREALADRLGRVSGKPASEMVIEDRGQQR